MATHPVFISYARDASREHANALHEALGGETAFLDTDAITIGARFPETLVDALFGAQVVVIFAEPSYFTRWYCLLEFRIARTPFLRAVERSGATAQEKAGALRGLVVAMPPHGVDPMMDRFPPLVKARNWPAVGDTERIAKLVKAELDANPPPLSERFTSTAEAEHARSILLEATLLPQPLNTRNIPFIPEGGFPMSIRDAFVGRADDLWRIHDLLWTERGDPFIAAGLTGSIEAFGGVGKTRLALEYLHRFGPRYFKGGLFWINAESDPELQLYDVLRALNSNTPAIEVVRQASGGVSTAVSQAIRSRADDAPTPLFIIDNVPEPAANQPPKPLETWCPVLGAVPVLITSRRRVSLGEGASVVSLSIDVLDPAAAVDLLTAQTPREQLSDAEWSEIAEWVGYLPLALEVLNRLLLFAAMPPRDLLDLSRVQAPSSAVDRVMEFIRGVVPERKLRGITEAISASYSLLTPEEQNAARLVAWMAPAPVPTFVIDAFDPEIFSPRIRGKLRDRSFVIEVRDGSGIFHGAMHRVLADFTRAQIGAWEQEVETVAAVLTRLLQSAEGRGTTGSALVRDCAQVALSVFSNWIARPMTDEGFTAAWSFAVRAGGALRYWGHWPLASEIYTSLVSASEHICGKTHVYTLVVLI